MPASAAARAVLATVLVAALLVAEPVVRDAEGTDATDDDGTWREVARQMFVAASEQTFEGRMVVVSFDPTPSIGELTVVRDADGTMITGGPSRWVLGLHAGETVLGDFATGELLRVGAERRPTFSITRLVRNYDVRIAGEEPGVGGPATVLEFRPRGGGHVRERVHVDARSGVVVRRETYEEDGSPVRLATFTALSLGPVAPRDVGSGWVTHDVNPMSAPVSRRGIEILRDTGWHVPSDLPGGFGLVDATAVGAGVESSLHLLYTDGLYALSVYQQRGALDVPAMRARGALPAHLGPMAVLRWPRSEPATYLWTGESRTFTAVTDAPRDALEHALGRFPHDGAPSLVERLRRGLARLWPW